MYFFKKVVVIIGTLVLVQTAVFAEPSKKETAEFISKKTTTTTPSYPSSNCNDEISYESFVEFSNNYCTLTNIDIFYNEGCESKGKDLKAFEIINLKDVDPTRITIGTDGTGVYLNTIEEKEIIKNHYWYYSGNYQNKTIGKHNQKNRAYTTLYTFNSSVNTIKLKNAIKHLVKLCGGKGELF